MITEAVEITTENAHRYSIELNYALSVEDYKDHPHRWNTYYLVADDNGLFLIDPVKFDSKYRFITPIHNDELHLVEVI